jgi:long-chain acyl-CoA synthetase
MPADRLLPLLDRLGPGFMQIYGLTEALHPVTCLRREEHVPGNPKLGSAGTLTSSCRIRIVDDAGNDMPDGEVGEWLIKGPITFDGYWLDPAETERTLRDGWVASGDLGYRDAEGYYWIVDRKKNVIISGGFNVYAAEVEAVLAGHPAVAEVVVVGLTHEDWGEAVHAVIHPNDGAPLTETDLIAWCRQRLAGYKTPKGITFADAPLPRNSAGKILRRHAAAMAAESRSARSHS